MPPPARRLRRILLSPLILLAALVFALEDWLWDPITRLVQRLLRWPLLRSLDALVRRLPPYASLAVLLTPGLMLMPLKFAGLALIAHGHPGLGLMLFAAAKVAGTALLAWLWAAVQPQVRRITWAARAIDRLLHLKAAVYAAVLAWPGVAAVRRRIKALGKRTRARWQAWRLARRLAARSRR